VRDTDDGRAERLEFRHRLGEQVRLEGAAGGEGRQVEMALCSKRIDQLPA
jgi:hypothetical protein